MKFLAALVLAPLTLGACVELDDSATVDETSTAQAATGELDMHGAPEHLFKGRGEASRGGGGGSPLMTNHGGTVLPTSKVQAIFWGSAWVNDQGFKDKITGLDTFFAGYGGSAYARASTEYDGTNGFVTATVTPIPHVVDSSSEPPSKALTTNSAVAKACAVAGQNPDPAAVYFLFTSTGAGHVSYCAWHSWGTCSNGNPIQVAYMPNIDGDPGCDPGDTSTGHSQGLAAVANVTAHELAEAITDPRGAGWFDSAGQENGDKCAWAFNGLVTLTGGSQWKLQGEWSNAAYNAGTGFANRSGQKGCLP